MDAVLISSWTRPAPGHAQEALSVFGDFMAFWEKQAADGRCEKQEVLISLDGRGMTMVRGEDEALWDITRSDEYRALNNRVLLHVDGHTVEMWATGSEIERIITSFGQALQG